MRLLLYSNYEDGLNFLLEKYNEEVIEAIKKLVSIKDSYYNLDGDFIVEKVVFAKNYFLDELKEYIETTFDDISWGYEDNLQEIKPCLEIICNFYKWEYDNKNNKLITT